MNIKPDPRFDLVLERDIDLPREAVWKAWTTPDELMPWFCPLPWRTVECKIDLRPGGVFHTVMRGPEGQLSPNTGCYLEVIENERLIWTNALVAGYRPAPKPATGPGLILTAAILLEPSGKGTRYRAIAMHENEESRDRHAKMGFHEGWGIALDQLVEHMKRK